MLVNRRSATLLIVLGLAPACTSDAEDAPGLDAEQDASDEDAMPALLCDDTPASLPSGTHNPGLPCSDCHDGTGEAPRWTLGGTLFDTTSGASLIAGARIRVTDSDDNTIELLSARNGNFWTQADLVFPLTDVSVTCTETLTMSGNVPSPGNCNACHRLEQTPPGPIFAQ